MGKYISRTEPHRHFSVGNLASLVRYGEFNMGVTETDKTVILNTASVSIVQESDDRVQALKYSMVA